MEKINESWKKYWWAWLLGIAAVGAAIWWAIANGIFSGGSSSSGGTYATPTSGSGSTDTTGSGGDGSGVVSALNTLGSQETANGQQIKSLTTSQAAAQAQTDKTSAGLVSAISNLTTQLANLEAVQGSAAQDSTAAYTSLQQEIAATQSTLAQTVAAAKNHIAATGGSTALQEAVASTPGAAAINNYHKGGGMIPAPVTSQASTLGSVAHTVAAAVTRRPSISPGAAAISSYHKGGYRLPAQQTRQAISHARAAVRPVARVVNLAPRDRLVP